MLLAHKIQLYPTRAQEALLRKAAGLRRHCWNQLVAYFFAIIDRDINAAINLMRYGLDRLSPDLKRTQEGRKTALAAVPLTA